MTDAEIERIAAEYIAEDWEPDRYYREMNLVAFATKLLEHGYGECRKDEREASMPEPASFKCAFDGAASLCESCTPETGCRHAQRECSSDYCEFEKDAERYRLIRSALLSGGPEWSKLAAMLNIAPDTATGVDEAVDATFS